MAPVTGSWLIYFFCKYLLCGYIYSCINDTNMNLSVLDLNSSENARDMYNAFKKAGCCGQVADDLTTMLRVVNALPLEKKEDKHSMLAFMLQEYFNQQVDESAPHECKDDDQKVDAVDATAVDELIDLMALSIESNVVQAPSPGHCDIKEVDI